MNASIYQKYLIFLAPYSIAVSSLYLFGFWSSFDVNVFEYIGLSDIIKTAIYQLAHYGAFILIGVIVSELFISPTVRKVLPPGEGADLPEAKFFRKYWRIPFLAVVGYALYIALFTESEVRWFLAAIILSPIVAFASSAVNVLEELVPNETMRSVVTYPILLIILFSYGWGTVDANSTKLHGEVVALNNAEPKMVYVGRAGHHVFFWDNDNQLVEILAESQVRSIKYKVIKEPPPFFTLFKLMLSEESNEPNNEIQPTPKGAAD